MDAKASAHHGGSTRVLVPARVGGSGVAPSYGTAGGHDSTRKQPHTDDLRSINSSTRSLPFKPPGPATKEPSSSSLHGFLRGDTRDFLRDYYGVGGRDVSSHIVSLDVRVWRAWKHGSLAFGLGVCICLVALLIPLGWGAPDGSLSYWVYSLGFEQWFTAISTLVVLCEVGLAIPGMPTLLQALLVCVSVGVSAGSFVLFSEKYCHGTVPTGFFKTFVPFIPCLLLWTAYGAWALYLRCRFYTPALAVVQRERDEEQAHMTVIPEGVKRQLVPKAEACNRFFQLYAISGPLTAGRRVFDPRLGISTSFRLHRDPLVQWLAAVLFVGGNLAVFEFCEVEAILQFSSKSNSRMDQLTEFALFVIVVVVLKGFMKFVGFFIDCGKTGGMSFYIAGEFVGLMNYYMFLRAMFLEVHADTEFVALIAMHCVSEFLQYPFRMSQYYYDTSRATVTAAPFIPEWLKSVLRQDSVSEEEWVWKLCLDYSLRVVVVLLSLVTYIGFFVLVRFGYNCEFFPYFSPENTPDSKFYRLLITLSITAVVEACMIVTIGLWVSRRHRLPAFRPLRVLLSSPHLLMFFVFATGAFLMNIFVARVDTKHFSCDFDLSS